MAISPSVLADWIQPGAALTAVFGLAAFLWAEMRAIRAELKAEIQASEARQNKRIDELKDDMKELKDDMKEIRADIKSLLLAQQSLQRPAGAKV